MNRIGVYVLWCDYVLHEVIVFLKLQVHSFLKFGFLNCDYAFKFKNAASHFLYFLIGKQLL